MKDLSKLSDMPAERTTLNASIIENQKVTFQAMQGAEMPELLGIEMTMPQFKILFLLYTHGDLKMSEIASRVGKNMSTATGVVDRLAEQKFIRREEDPEDRRVVKITLTKQGQEFCRSLLQFSWSHIEAILSRLTLEQLRVVEEGTRLFSEVAIEDARERLAVQRIRKTN